jgi:hypothetical protein
LAQRRVAAAARAIRRKSAVLSGMPDPWDDWFVSYEAIPVESIRCIGYGDMRFKTATYEAEVLNFVAFS